MKNCLQAAAARIYDESADVNRATKRIEILHQLLLDDGSQETGFKIDLYVYTVEVDGLHSINYNFLDWGYTVYNSISQHHITSLL